MRDNVLREWEIGDGEWYAAQLDDPEIGRFTSDGPHVTAADFRAALTRFRDRPDWAGFAIVDPATGEPAGNIAADRTADGTAELSYWLAAPARGRGLATRALDEMCARLAERWPGCALTLWTHAANTASQRVAERAGFRYQPDRDEQRTLGRRTLPGPLVHPIMSPRTVPLSVLDTGTVFADGGAARTLADALVLARAAAELGYRRYWVAEHHNADSSATTAPAVLIAHLAAQTSGIRVGSGAVLLPNHAPLVVAEQFNTLATLHPDRIDLGLGRAPGGDPVTALALRRQGVTSGSEDYAAQLRELLGYLHPGDGAAGNEGPRALPRPERAPEVWLLASSPASARLAGELGLPLAVAHHLNPGQTGETLAVYRAACPPERARTMVCTAVVLADTDERARELAGPAGLARVRSAITGRPVVLPTTAEAKAHSYDAFERDLLEQSGTSGAVVGGPDTAAAQLAWLLDTTGADELIVMTPVAELADRLHSFRLLRRLI